MKEMLWHKPPVTIELYKLKKELNVLVPEYKDVSIASLKSE